MLEIVSYVTIKTARIILSPQIALVEGAYVKMQIKLEKPGETQRHNWIDVAKGIGIILVVFAHVNFTPAILDTIYSFHMPLFFVISGMLYNRGKYVSFSQFLKRKVQTLICPYILFYMLVLAYTQVYKLLLAGVFDWENLLENFVQMFLSQGSGKVVSAPLWFVLCLFAVEIIFYFVSMLNNKAVICVVACLVVAGWGFETYVVSKYMVLLPWSIDSALFALGFYTIGNLFSDQLKKVGSWLGGHKYSIAIGLAFCAVAMTFTAFLGLKNGHVSMGSKLLNNGFIFYATGIMGALSVFALAVLLRNSRFLAYCGRNSFCIMAVHVTIKKTYLAAADYVKVIAYDSEILVQTILPFGVVLGLSLVFTILYNKVKELILRRRCVLV